MVFVIRRTDSWGGYISHAGRASSYVVNPADARHFTTRGEADGARCKGNEIVVPYEPRKRA